MYKELIEIAKKIIVVAGVREKEEILNAEDGFFKMSANVARDSFSQPDPYQEKLLDIFDELDLEQIVALQAIMYLGRDKDYDSSLSPDEIFQTRLEEIKSAGVKTKEIEIQQMIEKIPFGSYLRDGYQILGIEI